MTGGTTRFDRFVIVDWSAAATPRTGRDSIWIADLEREGRLTVANPPTRGAAADRLGHRLRAAARAGERVLVGFDFPLGYPSGFAAQLGLTGPSWRSVAQLLTDLLHDDPASNANNRFEVADRLNARAGVELFWGRPAGRPLPHLSDRRDRVDYTRVGEWRECERLLRAAGTHPQSVWKLLGAGSVGGQALTGIPVVSRLRHDPHLAPVSAVWPFEDHAAQARVVLAEVWPSLVAWDRGTRGVRDRRQVTALAQTLRHADGNGTLARALAAPRGALAEEGWILLAGG